MDSNNIEYEMTINYVTSDGWWDTDKCLLPKLCKHFYMNVFVFDGALGPYNNIEKKDYGCNFFLHLRQKYRDRDIRESWESFCFFFKILKRSRKSNTVNFIIPNKNPYMLVYEILFLPSYNTIFCTHNYIEHVGRRKSIMAILKKIAYKRFKHFHFYSELQKQMFLKEYPNKKAMHITMPLKDYGEPSVMREDLKTRTFLFFGVIAAYKRLDLFIKAANSFDGYNVKFIIAGNCKTGWNDYEGMMVNRSLFKTDIRFIEESEVANYFALTDFLVLPYADATQSGPSLIAMKYGVPIIASNLPAFRDIVEDGYNGFLFETGDFEHLSKSIRKAIELTSEQLSNMKENQRVKALEYENSCDVISVWSNFFKENIIYSDKNKKND